LPWERKGDPSLESAARTPHGAELAMGAITFRILGGEVAAWSRIRKAVRKYLYFGKRGSRQGLSRLRAEGGENPMVRKVRY